MRDRPLLAVAHRAGNQVAELHAALEAGVDLVEADVHLRRRVLEVRHWKALGPHLLWDGRVVVRRRDVVVPDLAGLLAPESVAAVDCARMMLDLKGLHPGLAPAVAEYLRRVAPGVPVAVCTRHWWMFRAFADDPHVRVVLSAGSRRGLRRLRARLRGVPGGGMSGGGVSGGGVSGGGVSGGGVSGGGVAGVSVHRRLLTPAVVDELHRSVGYVLTWPVDEPAALADARRLGVGGVISKSLPLLRRVLADRR